jgi:hypothetical protein
VPICLSSYFASEYWVLILALSAGYSCFRCMRAAHYSGLSWFVGVVKILCRALGSK